MKTIGFWTGLFGMMILFCGAAFSGETGHYVPGVEGIKAGSVPPPGLYYKLYNAFYNADTLNDRYGDEIDVGFDVSVYAMVHRFLWVSDIEILGASYAADILVPLVSTDLKIDAAGIEDDRFGLGDICVEPLVLSRHGNRYDAVFGAGFFVPTGDYDVTEPASPGKDHWGLIFTLGGTWYPDEEKTWSASVLSRYETHFEKDETDVQPGDNLVIEWGVARNINKIFDAGLTGYCTWQLTDDKGADAREKNVHDRAFAAGPEVTAFVPPLKLFVTLRAQKEFHVRDRSEGSMIVLNFVKIF